MLQRSFAPALFAWALILCTPLAPAAAQNRHDTDPRYLDAHVDRVIFAPTAEVHPEGTLYGSLYEIIIGQIGYALTSRAQLSLTMFSNYQARPSFFAEATLKANLLRTRRLKVAALTALDFIQIYDDAGTRERLVFGRMGGSLQLCLDHACVSHLNLSAMAVLFDKADLLFPFGMALGLVARFAGIAKLLLEYGTLNTFTEGLPIGSLPVWYVAYGVRLSKATWGLDLTLVRNLDDRLHADDGDKVFDLIGLPFLAVTYRFGQD